MAVSMYCTAVCMTCSTMVGQASAMMTPSMPQSRVFNVFVMGKILSVHIKRFADQSTDITIIQP